MNCNETKPYLAQKEQRRRRFVAATSSSPLSSLVGLGFIQPSFNKVTLIVRVSQLCLLRSVISVIDGNKSFDQKSY